MPNFRRSGAFTAWGNSWLRGSVSYDEVVDALHEVGIRTVRGLPGHPEPVPVGWGMSAVRAGGGTPLRLVLPAAGDIRGVPVVPRLAEAAIQAEQLVVGPGIAFIPDADPSSDGDLLAWDVSGAASAPATPGEQQTISQAAGALRLGILEAADALARLDVARWNPAVESLRRRERGVRLPPDHEPSAAALVASCTQIAAILELARADAPGGAISANGATHRDAALRPLAVTIREALMTAYSATCDRRSADR